MPKICYQAKKFSPTAQKIIDVANSIIIEYATQGFDLTLRQLYYQFVSRGYLPNRPEEYNRLGGIINDARLAGEIDWEAIVDRTRNLRNNSHWKQPQDIIKAAADDYRNNLWRNQPNYVEVWIEKDALLGVIAGVCTSLDAPFFSCRGYTSASEMWVASQRLIRRIDKGKAAYIIHLGDHDPSGLDMSRDIKERLTLFLQGRHVTVRRIALNWPQIQRLNPPPNPTKMTDSRAKDYLAKYGAECWELDALDPMTLVNLIRSAVTQLRDEDIYRSDLRAQEEGRRTLKEIVLQWADILKVLRRAQ